MDRMIRGAKWCRQVGESWTVIAYWGFNSVTWGDDCNMQEMWTCCQKMPYNSRKKNYSRYIWHVIMAVKIRWLVHIQKKKKKCFMWRKLFLFYNFRRQHASTLGGPGWKCLKKIEKEESINTARGRIALSRGVLYLEKHGVLHLLPAKSRSTPWQEPLHRLPILSTNLSGWQ